MIKIIKGVNNISKLKKIEEKREKEIIERRLYLENKFTPRAKGEAKKLLKEIGIERFLTFDDIDKFGSELSFNVTSLVNAYEDGEQIDNELLKIYDLLTDITLDNEENLII